MPLTTRARRRASIRSVLATLLATGLLFSAAGAAAADPLPDASTTSPASTTVITPGTGPLSVAVIVPIVVPPTTSGLISPEDLARFTDTAGLLSRQLDSIAGTPAALAIDPMILASIRVLGTAAPDSARAWLSRLEALPNESFLLAYGDADLLTAVRTGTLDVVAPSGFGFALDPGRFSDPVTDAPTLAPTPTPTDAPTADPDAAPPFPTTEQLLAWTTTLPTIAWPHGPGVGAADATALGDAGYGSLLLSDADTGPVAGAHVTVDGRDALVLDSARSLALRTAASSIIEADRTVLLESLTADLAAQAAATPGRTIVLTLGRTWPNTTSSLSESLTAISASGAAQLVALGEVLASPTTTAALGEGIRDTDREAVFTSLVDDVAAEAQFSTVLADSAALLDPRRLENIALYAVAWVGDDAWPDAVAAFRERSDQIVTSVRIERGSDLVLLARNTGFRVSVSNALDLPITVRVSLDPRSPILRSEETVDLTVEPNATASAYVPVEAIANGDVRVITSLESPAGVPIDSGFANISIRAEWENLGTLAFVLVLIVVFAAGIIRIVLRRRKARREAAAEATDADALVPLDATPEAEDTRD